MRRTERAFALLESFFDASLRLKLNRLIDSEA